MLFADTVWFTGFCNTRLKEGVCYWRWQKLSRRFGKKRKGNQQRSLVEDEFKVVNKHPTGDVRDAQTDEPHSGEIKRYQPPWAVFPVFRGTEAKVWVVVWLRGSSDMWSNSQGLVPRKGKTCGPESEPWRTPVKAASKKKLFLSTSSQILTNELNMKPTVI